MALVAAGLDNKKKQFERLNLKPWVLLPAQGLYTAEQEMLGLKAYARSNSRNPQLPRRSSMLEPSCRLETVFAKVSGCEACLAGELLEFSDGALGLALNLESKAVGAVRFASSFGKYYRDRQPGKMTVAVSVARNVFGRDLLKSYDERTQLVRDLGASLLKRAFRMAADELVIRVYLGSETTRSMGLATDDRWAW